MKDETASKCVSKSIGLWNKSKKEIKYSDRLTKRERALIMTDPEISGMALQIKDIEKQIVRRIDELVNADRLKSEREKEEEARRFVRGQKEGAVSK